MKRAKLVTASIAAMMLLATLTICSGLVGESSRGDWPKSWPQELDSLREHSRTISIGTMVQEEIYDLKFRDRETFERLWRIILSLKSKGGTLTLYRVGPTRPAKCPAFLSNQNPSVRIYAPSVGGPVGGSEAAEAVAKDPRILEHPETVAQYLAAGKMLMVGPPWPESILNNKGELPEYAMAREVNGRMMWLPARSEEEKKGFYNRARVDLELVVDGEIIDLNRIALPPDTPIIDKRSF